MPPDVNDLLKSARQEIPEISADDLQKELASGNITLVDVREDEEWNTGHLPGAIHVSRGMLEMRIGQVAPNKETDLVLYCAGGNRSLLAAQTLNRLGYGNVRSLSGGINGWAQSGLPVERDESFTPEQMEQYSRHITLPQVGLEGQKKIMNARTLVVGAGGLGSPAALYLAAAGVGTLGIIDSDKVDRSNLQRQVIHDTQRIGMSKALSAKETVERLNPEVNVIPYPERLNRDNIGALMEKYDFFVDGTDNFETRYLLNDAAYFAGKPIVHGSIFRFEGQMTVLHPRAGGPCYRCIFPEAAGGDRAPT